jgi:A/G-specific adenine glycosylase
MQGRLPDWVSGFFMKNTFNFATALLDWYDQHGRKDLPWQCNPTPYRVWVSEIMLQQTQVSTVIGYYQRFMDRFPDLDSLAAASIDDVLSYWAGLGYYARGRNLHRAAKQIVDEHAGQLPNDLDALMALPGIGRSTAGAIMALGFHQRFPILDGNVKRVLTRFEAIEGWPGQKQIENHLWQRVAALLPEDRVANYIQAQMDLGATLCTRSQPACERCPLQSHCQAYLQGQPSAYPTAKPKKMTPTRSTHWLVCINRNNEVLLQKRPDKGIWGGLWAFPESTLPPAADLYYSLVGIAPSNIVIDEAIHHVFTHFKLTVTPHRLYFQSELQENIPSAHWYTITNALKLGLPAPVASYLQSLE